MSGCGSSFSCCVSTTSSMIYKGLRDRGRVSFIFLLLSIYRSTTFISHAISACFSSPLYTWSLSLSSTANTQAVARLSPVTLHHELLKSSDDLQKPGVFRYSPLSFFCFPICHRGSTSVLRSWLVSFVLSHTCGCGVCPAMLSSPMRLCVGCSIFISFVLCLC